MQRMQTFPVLMVTAIAASVMSGAIFGFFYAWLCSTMWGLDNADPNIAITAMQAMNASVRNPFFALIFFGTPLILAMASLNSYRTKHSRAAILFGLAGTSYFTGGVLITITMNVPLNNQLALLTAPLDLEQAKNIWNTYSTQWQYWNTLRTLASGISLILACMGLYHLGANRISTK